MTRHRSCASALFVVSLFACSGAASAAITQYFNGSGWTAWQSDAAGFLTIDFTGYPQFTSITDQYTESHGATFGAIVPPWLPPEQTPLPQVFFGDYFLKDGVGVAAPYGVELTLNTPQRAIGLHLPGAASFKLFFGQILIGETFSGTAGAGSFHGLTSSVAFDRVQIKSFGDIGDDPLFFDNLYFSTVPGPGPLAFFAVGAVVGARRRR